MKKILLFTLIVFTITLQGQNKLLSSTYENYTGSTWQKYYGSNYEYDGNKNLTTQIDFEWVESESAWRYSQKQIYTYNANNRGVTLIYQEWNTTNNLFINQYKEIYSYDTNNNPIEIISQNWNGFEWANESKTTINYQSNLISEYIGLEWDGSQWLNESRGTFTYNSNNKCTGNVEYNWNNGQWVTYSRDSYTYDSNNKILTSKNEKWENNSWKVDSQSEYTLDNQGNRISETESTDLLTNQYKETYSYDTGSLMSSFAHPFKEKTGLDYIFEDYPYVNKLLTSENYYYNNETSVYVLNGKTSYNYESAISLSTKSFESKKEVVKLFPNPSTDYIELSGLTESQDYKIYNILGVLVKKGSITSNEKIEIQNLPNAFYFLKLESGKTIKFKKK